MSAPAFTLGPWSVLGQNLSGEFEVIAPSRETVCVVLVDEERAEADARLIAAAPELYAALRAIVEAERAAFAEWRASGGPEWKPEHPAFARYNAACAALAKAEGRE